MTELFLVFLRIGILGFGGPLGLVSLIRTEVCVNRPWIQPSDFDEALTLCKLLPGALAIQMVIVCGYKRLYTLGGIVAGLAFMLPALLITLILAYLYAHGSKYFFNNHMHLMFRCIQDVTLAIILITVYELSKKNLNSFMTFSIALTSLLLVYCYPSYEPWVIISFGIAGALPFIFKKIKHQINYPLLMMGNLDASKFTLIQQLWANKWCSIFYVFFKASAFSFGTGLAIIPLLHDDLVTKLHLLSQQQFIDGITIGQITPGPTAISSVAFFAYISSGLWATLVAVIGFYTPTFFCSLVIFPFLQKKINKSEDLLKIVAFIFPSVIGAILAAVINLGIATYTNFWDLILVTISFYILYKKLIPTYLIILLAGTAGLII